MKLLNLYQICDCLLQTPVFSRLSLQRGIKILEIYDLDETYRAYRLKYIRITTDTFTSSINFEPAAQSAHTVSIMRVG